MNGGASSGGPTTIATATHSNTIAPKSMIMFNLLFLRKFIFFLPHKSVVSYLTHRSFYLKSSKFDWSLNLIEKKKE
jgi:hypothetical protein